MAFTTLVSTAELASHLEDPRWIVFDCRHDLAQPGAGEQAYCVGHIPGARFLHLDRDLAGPLTGSNGRHPLPAPALFAAKVTAAGVQPESQVVAYDAAGGMYAARLWWMLRWLGHDAVAVLDGGWNRWQQEQRSTTQTVPPARKVTMPGYLNDAPRSIAVNTDFVLSHRHDQETLIVDARAESRYRGKNETLDPVGGHIPGALNRFFQNNLDQDGRFKPAERLRLEFQQLLGSRDARGVIHQCGSGVSACHNLLAMEVAGLAGSRLYPGSWSEWCTDPARPMVKGQGA